MSKSDEIATTADAALAAVLGEAFAKIPGMTETVITGDEVDFHDGAKISLPRDMTYSRAYKVLKRLEEENEQETAFTRMYRYRPDDGAYAAFLALKEHFGIGVGKTIFTFFGPKPPEMRTITIGVNQTMQVPWGHMEVPSMPGLELFIGEAQDDDYGTVFGIRGTGPKKYKVEVERYFDLVQEKLETNSIYRGRAIIGSNNPQFIDLSSFRADQVVFADDVMNTLEGTLWSPIRYADAMRSEGVPLKRAILLHGPYGTGKTSTGQLTAEVATAAGWTFISARPGKDKVADVLRTARLYQPAVVFIEDIDGQASSGNDDEVTKLLEAFDGITAKGGELMVVMTTNHIERIHKGMLRPGRLDAVLEIAALDRNGVERLVRAVVASSKLDKDTDFDAVYEAMDGFFPAFVREAINRAVTFAIGRGQGSPDYKIGTPDLVGAAHSLKPQLDALNEAGEGEKPPALDAAIGAAVRSSLIGLQIEDNAHGERNLLKEPEDD